MPIPWWQRGAIYQIYPRSFADSDGDGIGDLRGIIDRLDHLADLRVAGIWLSPFYPSPMADFGYDVADYRGVDPVFGTLQDFDELVREAHARDIRVVIDLVPNHTSDQHPWFAESRSSRDNPKRDWYVWRDGRGPGTPPNDWKSSFPAVGGAWTYDEATEQWYLHSFLPQQPDLNWDEPEVEAAIHDVMRFWCDRGVDGFRIDVVYKLAKDPLLRDPAPGAPVTWEDWQPTIHERLRRLRSVVDEYPERVLVGEVYLLDLERVVAYVNSGDELHLAHNFVFVHLPWDAAAFRGAIDSFEALSTEAAWPAWFLANHDHPRVASRFGERQARAVLLMLYALRGTPFVYQGEELGLPDAEIAPDRVVDVDGRDPERAPIPWLPPSQAGPGAGFSAGEPWLPITSRAEELNAQRQAGDGDSALSLARRLASLRAREPVLQDGGQRSLDAGDDLLAWLRVAADQRMLAVVNFAGAQRPFSAAPDLPQTARLELSTDPGRGPGPLDLRDLTLGPYEALLAHV
ncbi:alpha-amylase family glycosyl hydrolase [Capillimicrobium parvum]|uniref:Oligo-1,6-glucosidase 1 n=1 Tax=Capillimicrobium parvum TaxID=2884022 RepID=A0A9E6Y2T0_9ACTN|nr:alpha-amylase family glycosyl hydrolase [Capillimicrobium parvum]UGS38944.1 Oligo-1,6-glucosidase 1 [Capillimicrobium parvum]